MVGKSEWKRPFGSYIRMQSKITALKNLDWNILVTDKAQGVFVLFLTRQLNFGFHGGVGATYWLAERLKSLQKIAAQLTQLFLYFVH